MRSAASLRTASRACSPRAASTRVYIGPPPHAQHHELARPVLEAGVPVLVEKAFSLNTAQARDLLALARERGVFAMEAMWARFLPQHDLLRGVIEAGLLGEIVEVAADHGQAMPTDPSHRMNASGSAAGRCWILGVYPISFAQMVLGDLEDPVVRGELDPTGVDATLGLLAQGARGGFARPGTTLRTRTPAEAVVARAPRARWPV